LTFWTTVGPANSAVQLTGVANTIRVWGLYIPARVVFSNITVYVNTADAVNSYDFGLYNSGGNLVAHIGAQTLPATAVQSFAVVGAPITLAPGLYFFAGTGNATTAQILQGDATGGPSFHYCFVASQGVSAGGALPATIAAPAAALDRGNNPQFALS
jgi:hypothetical protein